MTGLKKSAFTALTSIDDASTLDFVINGQNFKITKANFLAALGVTGTISQAGDTAGTPVLDGASPDFLIRTLENGAGVKSSVSPKNGITLDHNFTQATVGVPVLGSPLATSPIIRSVVAGDGATVTLVGNAIQVGLGAGQAIPDGIVFVQSEADFPDQSGGISTLEEKIYILSLPGIIDVSFRIKFASSRSVITGWNPLTSQLNFTTVSASPNIINDAGITIAIANIIISSPTAPMFGCIGSPTSIFNLDNIVLVDTVDPGTADSFVRSSINNMLINFDVTGALEFLGSSITVVLNSVQSAANNTTPNFKITDAGVSVTNLSVTNCANRLLTGTNKFIDIDPTKVTAGIVAQCSFSGPGSPSEPLGASIDNTTPNIILDQVGGVDDTRKIGSVSRAPGTVTIVTISVPVEIGGSWLGANLSQFSALNPGIEYDGADAGDIFQLSANVSGSKAGATGSDIYTCAIYINDVLVADSLAISEISDKGGSFFMNTFTTLATNDHITLYLSNENSTENFNLTEAKISVNRVS